MDSDIELNEVLKELFKEGILYVPGYCMKKFGGGANKYNYIMARLQSFGFANFYGNMTMIITEEGREVVKNGGFMEYLNAINKKSNNTNSPVEKKEGIFKISHSSVMEKEKSKVDILLEEYRTLTAYFNTLLPEYKQQTNHLGIYATIFGGLLYYVFTSDFFTKSINGSISERLMPLMLLGISVFILYYLIANLLDTLDHLYYHEFRIAAIEKKINMIYREELMIWESKIISKLHDVTFLGHKLWINSAYLQAFTLLVIESGLTFLHWMLCYKFVGDVAWVVYVDLTAILSGFIVYQSWLFNFVAAPYIKDEIFELSGLEAYHHEERFNLFLVPFLTIIFGWLSFVTLSIIEGVFQSYPDQNIIGVITLPSVIAGDLILLPVINYLIAELVIKIIPLSFLKENLRTLLVMAVGSLGISGFINFKTHEIWSNDSILDFISTRNGVWSLSGWWHFIFSVLEMTIVFFFILFTLFCYSRKLIAVFKPVRKILFYLFLFSLLSGLDFYSKCYQLGFYDPSSVCEYFSSPLNYISPIIALLILSVNLFLQSRILKR